LVVCALQKTWLAASSGKFPFAAKSWRDSAEIVM